MASTTPSIGPLNLPPLQGPAAIGPMVPGPTAAWIALFVNVMAFIGTTVLPVPGSLGQAVAQAMLPLALILALLANPHVVIRPNLYLALISLLPLLALMLGPHNEFPMGSTYRALRLLGFVAVLWILSPWLGRADVPLLRAHMLWLRVIVGSVLAGMIAIPGAAFNEGGRLGGVIWPIPPTQVGHYSAVLIGCTTILWFCGRCRGRTALITLLAAGTTLVSSHTRTALAGLVVGTVLAGISLFVRHARVRRTAAALITVLVVAGIPLGSAVVAWLGRGEGTDNARTLTGRTKVWDRIRAEDRDDLTTLLGSGLSDKSYDGLPIDSSWFATYHELGLAGIAIQVAVLVTLLITALRRPPGTRRAIALFLITYCFIASFTETGLGDASPYLLELYLAAAMLASPPGPMRDSPPTPRDSGIRVSMPPAQRRADR